jgi:hypothetical protein
MKRVEFTIDVDGLNKPPRKVNVRADLPVGSLITAVKDHFSLNGQYELFLADASAALDPEQPLDAAGVNPGAHLRCVQLRTPSTTPALIERGQKRRFSQKFERVFFLEQRTFDEFQLNWWPAVIGRRDRSDPARNRLLAIDLERHEETPTISRHHACVTESGGAFFIEVLQTRNPVFLNGKALEPGVRHALNAGSTLQLGQIRLNFNVRT